jgi:dihydroneopterin aldolase
MIDRLAPYGRLDAEPETEAAVPADRVFLSNYVREVEIGAYAEEHGAPQRLRFDVVLEVARNTAHVDDTVGRVLNYDDLVRAIEDLAAGPRINLLETFAERLAQALLVDRRARRVHIRVQKLDRLPGGASLGCEITRVRTPETSEKVWALPEAKQP